MAANVMEIYGSKVFNEHVMKERLPSATYKSLKNTLHKGAPLDIEVANVVANILTVPLLPVLPQSVPHQAPDPSVFCDRYALYHSQNLLHTAF